MASSSRICQTVVRLIVLFSSSCARLVRSVVDWRLNGFPVRATTSHAMEVIMARSRGGKDRLAASSRSVFEGKLACGPALPPAANAVGGGAQPSTDFDIGKRGLLVPEHA